MAAPKISNASANLTQPSGMFEPCSPVVARGGNIKSPQGLTPRRSPRFANRPSNTPQASSHLTAMGLDKAAQSPGMRKSSLSGRHSAAPQVGKHRLKTNVSRHVSDEQQASQQTSITWDTLTVTMTSLSTVPFLFLLVPQVYKNALQLMAGNSKALAIISWAGYTSGMIANLLLFSYFASKGEGSATFVQIIGVTSTAVLLVQVFIAGFFPAHFFWPIAAIITVGVALGLFKMANALDDRVWKVWQAVLGLIGLAMLPQTLCMAFVPTTTSAMPALTGALLGVSYVALEEFRLLPAQLLGLRPRISAWTATLLFMLMPLPQLANNFSNPASVHGLSVLSIVLGMIGNTLMIPRALFTRDLVWFVGCSWGATLMGWAQLLSFTIAGALSPVLFWTVTLVYFGFLSYVLSRDSREHELARPLKSLGELFSPSAPKLAV